MKEGAGGNAADGGKAPAGQVERVRDLVHALVNTIQTARLFPPDHQTVVNFVADLHGRLSGYLEAHGELEIGIEEQSLTFAGRPVYEDPVAAKSLPFFFFKDGMRALVFCRGLKTTRSGSYWRRSARCRPCRPRKAISSMSSGKETSPTSAYLAPDDYLETKIGQGRQPPRMAG